MRLIARTLLALMLCLLLGMMAYSAIALTLWRDIPVATLEQRYGDAALSQTLIDGVSVRYRLQGQPVHQAPTLVLIHNHFMDMGLWDNWVDELGAQFSLLRYDLSGHGLTGPDPSGRYSVSRDVSLLQDLLNQLGLDQVHLVGSSLGGNIAFTYAARHPHQVQSLTLINSGGLRRDNSRSGREMPGWASLALRLLPPQAYHAFLRWMVIDDSALKPAHLQRFVDMFRRRGNRPAEIARLSQYETGQPEELLRQIRAPSLILWGEDNPQLPRALAQRFVESLTGAAAVHSTVFPGAGHVLPLERPIASAQATREFVLRHTPPPIQP